MRDCDLHLQVRRARPREVKGQSWRWNVSSNSGPRAQPTCATKASFPVTSGETEVQRGVVTYQDQASGSDAVQAHVH